MTETPKRHILAQNREFWRLLRQNLSMGLGYRVARTPKKPCNLARKVTHAQKQNPWADCDELLHRCKGPRRNHLCQFLLLPLTGFRRGGGSNFGLLHWLASSPLQHLALPCECEIYEWSILNWWRQIIPVIIRTFKFNRFLYVCVWERYIPNRDRQRDRKSWVMTDLIASYYFG